MVLRPAGSYPFLEEQASFREIARDFTSLCLTCTLLRRALYAATGEPDRAHGGLAGD